MPISFKSKLSSSVANATFLDKTIDDLKKGKLGLYKVSTDKLIEPTSVEDLQVYLSELADASGVDNEGDATRKNYSSNNYVANGDNRKVAIGKLDAQVGTNAANIATNTSDIASLDGRVTDIENDYGQPNGLATLDGSGLVPLAQLPNSLLIYQGTWDASTNTPTLSNGTGTNNFWYRVNVAGSVDFGAGSIAFNVGDKVVYSPSGVWEKWDTSDEVVSVNGQTGVVVLDKTDIGLSNVTNDAQLTRAAGDFNTFTEKVTPVNDDIVLIEDSEDSFSKKKVKLSNMLGGGGGGGLDVYYTESMDDLLNVSGFSTGNNASFLGGGSLAGTLALETVNPISGTQSLKYTQASGSLNDYVASPLIDIEQKQQSNDSGMTLYFEYDGDDNDIRFVVWDVTNSQRLSSELALVKQTGKATRYSLSFFVPASCTQIRWGYQVLVENIGAILLVDDVELSTDPFAYSDLYKSQEMRFGPGSVSFGSTFTSARRFNPPISTKGSSIFRFVDDVSTGSYIEALTACRLSLTYSGSYNTVGTPATFITLNQLVSSPGTQAIVINQKPSGGFYNFASISEVELSPGDKIRVNVNSAGIVVSSEYMVVSAEASTPHILTPVDTFSTDTAPLTYAPSSQYTLSTLANAPVGTFITFTTAAGSNVLTQTTTAPSQSVSDMNTNGILLTARVGGFSAGTTASNPGAFAIQIGKGLKGRDVAAYFSSGKESPISTDYVIYGSSESGITKSYNETTGVLLLDALLCVQGGSTTNRQAGLDIAGNAVRGSAYLVINASKNPALSGLPNPLTAYLKDVKPSGTAGGTFTSGAWQTRTLNTIEGDSSFVTLSSNQFTLQPGQYEIEASAPALGVNQHKAKLRNITASIDAIIGSSDYTLSTNGVVTKSNVIGTVTVATASTFEFQHYCQTTKATDGFGTQSTIGVSEIYAQVKITKVR